MSESINHTAEASTGAKHPVKHKDCEGVPSREQGSNILELENRCQILSNMNSDPIAHHLISNNHDLGTGSSLKIPCRETTPVCIPQTISSDDKSDNALNSDHQTTDKTRTDKGWSRQV